MEDGLHILQHSIGADQYGRIVRGGGRNHFCTGEGRDHSICMDLVRRGLMRRHAGSAISGGDDIFHVTPAGFVYVTEKSPAPPKLSRAQQRYEQWLREDCNMSFGDWLRCGGWKARA